MVEVPVYSDLGVPIGTTMAPASEVDTRPVMPFDQQMGNLSDKLHVPQGYVKNSYDQAVAGLSNSNNSWGERGVNLLLSTAMLPLAIAEEGFRGVLNIPSALAGAVPQASQAGTQIGIALDSSQPTEERVIGGLKATTLLTSAFNGMAGAAVALKPSLEIGGPPSYALGNAAIDGVPAAGAAADGAGQTVTVFRVQGGTPPLASRQLISIDENGNPVISRTTLNISVGAPAHAEYFLSKRPGADITSFDIPKWMGDFIDEEAIPQAGYRTNPANQGGLAPKVVDPTTPGRSYELPDIWAKWLEEVAIPGSGKVTKGGTP
jgi:hypothetical protein